MPFSNSSSPSSFSHLCCRSSSSSSVHHQWHWHVLFALLLLLMLKCVQSRAGQPSPMGVELDDETAEQYTDGVFVDSVPMNNGRVVPKRAFVEGQPSRRANRAHRMPNKMPKKLALFFDGTFGDFIAISWHHLLQRI